MKIVFSGEIDGSIGKFDWDALTAEDSSGIDPNSRAGKILKKMGLDPTQCHLKGILYERGYPEEVRICITGRHFKMVEDYEEETHEHPEQVQPRQR